jgi:hypothetical protein
MQHGDTRIDPIILHRLMLRWGVRVALCGGRALQLVSGQPFSAAGDSDIFISTKDLVASLDIIASFVRNLLGPAGFTHVEPIRYSAQQISRREKKNRELHYPLHFTVHTFRHFNGSSIQFIIANTDGLQQDQEARPAWEVINDFDLICCTVAITWAPTLQIRFGEYASDTIALGHNGFTAAFITTLQQLAPQRKPVAFRLRSVAARATKYEARGYHVPFHSLTGELLRLSSNPMTPTVASQAMFIIQNLSM